MRTRIERPSMTVLILLSAYLLFPGVAAAAEEAAKGFSPGILQFGRLFNLALVVGVLVWVARKPLANFYANRTQSIHDQLAAAQKAREEAEGKLAEIESRLSYLDDELKEIRAAAEREAKEEYDRLVAEAERDAEKIIARASDEIKGMMRAARLELKNHAAELSVQLAREKIEREITDEDHGRLFTRFVAKIGGRE